MLCDISRCTKVCNSQSPWYFDNYFHFGTRTESANKAEKIITKIELLAERLNLSVCTRNDRKEAMSLSSAAKNTHGSRYFFLRPFSRVSHSFVVPLSMWQSSFEIGASFRVHLLAGQHHDEDHTVLKTEDEALLFERKRKRESERRL